MTYQPTNIDIAWARDMLANVVDGGVMVFPAAGAIYEVSHTHKTLTLKNEELLSVNPEIHLRTTAVFSKVGYEVLPHLA